MYKNEYTTYSMQKEAVFIELICKGRGEGKTRDLILESARTGMPILTPYPTMQNLLEVKENNIMVKNVDLFMDCFTTGKLFYNPANPSIIIKNPSKVEDVNVIVPNKVVEVTFADGTKEKSVCREPDVFSLEQAIAICIGKKIMGGSGAYNNAIKHGLKVYEDKLKKEKIDKTEKERIANKRAKRIAYKKRKAAEREQAERERQIEIQKEAYIRAMEEMKITSSK